MSPFKYLAFAYDFHSLHDILKSHLNHEEIILLLPQSLEKDHSAQLSRIGTLLKIKNYLNSGEVETTAYTQFQKTPYQRIIATHEIDILRAARLRTLLQLPGQTYESALAFRQKTVMKKILQKHGFSSIPAFQAVTSPVDIIEFINTHSFPVVLKPDLGTGSEGVTIFQNAKHVFSYLNESSLFQANQPLDWLIEEFIEGKMYHINGFVKAGEITSCWPSVYPHQSICMTEGKFASSYLLSHTNPLVPRLNRYAQKVLTALPTPLTTPFHLEVFINRDDEIIFCEIASRLGGKGVRQSWAESFGIPLSQMFVGSQAGNLEQIETFEFPPQPHCLTGEIWFPTRTGKLENIESDCPFPFVKDYQTFYKTGDIINQAAKDINDCVCGISLLTAATEEEMQHHLDTIVMWIEKTIKWSPL